MDYTSVDYAAAVDVYFDELLEVIDWGRFDSLSHLTYPWRYIQGEHGLRLDMNRYLPKMEQVFQALIQKGKALEINTSGLRQSYGLTMPHLELLQRYHDLGGRLVTIGSDAHRWADVGAGLEQGMELLKLAGFHHIALYRNHEPIPLPIS